MAPKSKVVIREVAKDVWIFSYPFTRFGILPLGGRSTAIKLSSGDVWVLASTPLDEPTKTKLDELGPVKYIVSADIDHHFYLGIYNKAYPDAKVIGPAGLIEKTKKDGLEFDGAWGKDPEGTLYGFEDDIQHCYFSGFQKKDVAFLHISSRTLIEADLLFNLPSREQFSLTGSSGSFFLGNVNPSKGLHKRAVWGLGEDKEAMKRDAKTVSGWDFDRIIPCHGDVIETGGKAAWDEVYKWYLVGKS